MGLSVCQVIQNVDDLFDREELSAAPDAGWPDCFNSGVFVFVPSDETYRNLLAFAITSGSFDGKFVLLLTLYTCFQMNAAFYLNLATIFYSI